jgi:SAM-dependent methyltransferase
MVGRGVYDLMYRYWAPWDAVGVRADLRRLLDDGEVDPARFPRALDLGCGTGANVVFLAERGFRPVGVDFSRVALDKARQRALDAGVADRCRFVAGDLTAERIPGIGGPFDLVLDFGTIDDLNADGRRAAARTVERLSRPGARFLLWCFYAPRSDLPAFSLHGPSKLAPAIEPGEETALFGRAFAIKEFSRDAANRAACFLLTRRAGELSSPV